MRLGQRFTFQLGNDHTAKATLDWFKGKHGNIFEWTSQITDLNSIKNLWSDVKIADNQWEASNSKELDQFCREEWVKKIPVATCSKLLEMYPKGLAAAVATKGDSTKSRLLVVEPVVLSYLLFAS